MMTQNSNPDAFLLRVAFCGLRSILFLVVTFLSASHLVAQDHLSATQKSKAANKSPGHDIDPNKLIVDIIKAGELAKAGTDSGTELHILDKVRSVVSIHNKELISDEVRREFMSSRLSDNLIAELEAAFRNGFAKGLDGLAEVEELNMVLNVFSPPVNPLRFGIFNSIEKGKKLQSCGGNDACFWREVFSRDVDSNLRIFYQSEVAKRSTSVAKSFDENWLRNLALINLSEDCKPGSSCNSCESDKKFREEMGDIPFLGVASKAYSKQITGSFISSRPICREPIFSYLLKYGEEAINSAEVEDVSNIFVLLEDLGAPIEASAALHEKLYMSDHTALKNLKESRLSFEYFLSRSNAERMEMFVEGYLPGKIYILLLLVSFFMVILVSFIMYFLSSPLVSAINSFSGKKVNKNKVDLIEPERLDQYSALLAIFGLGESASDAEIKKAYRDRIKNLHPDSSESAEVQEFKDTKRAYERIMELRKVGFGD